MKDLRQPGSDRANEKTVIAWKPGAGPPESAASAPKPSLKPEPAKGTKAPKQVAPQKRGSALPFVVFGGLALVLLSVTAFLVTLHVMTGGQTEFTEASLNAPLVAVEEPQVAEPGPDEEQAPPYSGDLLQPKIIDLSGDPIIIKRRESALRQLVKLGDEAVAAAKPLGVQGEIYRFSDTLAAGDLGPINSLPGSQQSFAFFQSAGGGDQTQDDGGPEQPADSAGGETGQPTEIGAPALDQAAENASILTLDAEAGPEATPRKEVFKQVDRDLPASQVLGELGFAAESAKQIDLALAEILQIKSLAKNDQVAVRGYAPVPGDPQLMPAQLSIYRNGQYLGTLALTDKGTYAPGEDPWFGREIFQEQAQTATTSAKLRLLDAIYAAAVRNSLPTSVAGEIILLLSRAYDLDESVGEDERITVLFNNAARDPKTGFGRVLYVSIARASGNVECYAFQPKSGDQFECVSGDGTGTAAGGMVTPVKGVITAKFGPRSDAKASKAKMNFGVDWAAPTGTRVVAAFEGEVAFAGPNKSFGNFVKITHSENRATGYAYLQDFAANIAVGAKVRAGQVIGYVGQAGETQEPGLHFELYKDGQPVDPFGEYQRTIEKGGAVDSLVQRITIVESGNDCNARNPLSTAVGLGQFIESTWLRIIRDHRPDLMEGRSRAEILALRVICDIARDMTAALARENGAIIRARGFAVTPGNLYLAHFLGPGGATTALAASPNAAIIDVFGAGVVRANPFLSGKTASWVIEWAARKMNQKSPVVTAQAGNSKPQNRYAGNTAFLAMKTVINTMLQIGG